MRFHSLTAPLGAAALALASLTAAGSSDASETAKYEVTITNVTRGQTFTPRLFVTHSRHVRIFELGQTASPGLALLAEGGDPSGVVEELLAMPAEINDTEVLPGLLEPGQSDTVIIEATHYHRFLSLAAMLIPTNDTFVALNAVRLPHRRAERFALGYDAGTEANDQNCNNIPGPRCNGEGPSPAPAEGDEGFVYVSNGFHNLVPIGQPADETGEVLRPAVYDWRNPVAHVVVRRIR